MKPFIFCRDNGVWYIVDEDYRGKRKWTSTRTKNQQDAETVLAEYSVNREYTGNAPTLTKFTAEILEFIGASFTRKTMLVYRDALRALKQHTGDIPIDLVTVRDVDRFKTARVKQIKPISVNKDLATLKAAFNQALRWEYIADNPFARTKKLRIPDTPPAYFTRPKNSLYGWYSLRGALTDHPAFHVTHSDDWCLPLGDPATYLQEPEVS